MNRVFQRLLVSAIWPVLLLAAGHAQADTRLEMAYMPIIPCSQLFVLEDKGWAKESGLELALTRFSDGPAIVQAIASGKMDTMCFGIGPAMVSRAKGVKIKVVAAGIVEQIGIIVRGELSSYFQRLPAKEAILAFTRDKGRKIKLASFPKGSVPDTVGRYWLIEKVGLSTDDIEIVGMGASRVQQALLSGAVDAASILEPILTIVESKLSDAKVVARGGEMFPDQPGSVLAVREEFIASNREAVVKLVAQHIRATRLLQRDPKAMAPHVLEYVGKGLIDRPTMERALASPSSNFESDPRRIIESTRRMHDFQKAQGIQTRDVPIDELFDTSIYEDALKLLGG